MNAAAAFIQSLTDEELAFVYKYKYKGYLPPTQTEIRLQLARRLLTEERVESIITRVLDNPANIHCPRCNSDKRLEESPHCAVCGCDTIEARIERHTGLRILRWIVRFFSRGRYLAPD
jgi:hypothetical protein